ncbi:MAG TPA: DUF551 domain-containing protein [Nitrospira sp.]|nr:DUF551 domain-containing protein [Nitrospira sp.]
MTWISVKERKPTTGAPCWIIWSGVVQLVSYRRAGIGFACADGYEWEQAIDIGCDAIPDKEVTHWQYIPAPPEEKPKHGE